MDRAAEQRTGAGTEQRIELDQGRSCCPVCGGTFAGVVRANRTAQEAAAPKTQAATIAIGTPERHRRLTATAHG